MSESLTNICHEIKGYRLDAGLSQSQLADLAGIERCQISKIESGNLLGVTYETIERILNSFGRTLTSVTQTANSTINPRPFVKWAGGKTQLLDELYLHLPEKFNRYFEPFVGGGALLFKIKPKHFVINDTNTELMDAYKCFKSEINYEELKKLLQEHEANHSEEYYYKIRDEAKNGTDHMTIAQIAARFIYLNKSCFNGLYRVNSNGCFNVPSGKKETVKCYSEENFDNLRRFFRNSRCVIGNGDFEKAVQYAEAGDFVYFDPPYDTPDDKDSFTDYSKEGFGKDDQVRLAKVYKKLSDKGVYVMLSNHNTSLIKELYKDYNIYIVNAKRMINSVGNGRGPVEEVIITNY